MYIVDANNLAGKLKWLGKKNFDKKIIDALKKYFRGRNEKVIAVFDGQDPLGDKQNYQNISVIYSPRDKYIRSADDKIVELLRSYTAREGFNKPLIKECKIVTDDIELKRRVDKVLSAGRINVKFISSATLAGKLIPTSKHNQPPNNGFRGLASGEIEIINKDLLDIWK